MRRWLVYCLIGLSVLTARADAPAFVEQNFGICRFLLSHYDLSPKDQATINLIIGDLLQEHQKAFDFASDGSLRIQIRIFGSEDDYHAFSRTNHVQLEGRTPADVSSNLAGYYSVRDREVVTWRQHNPSYLANNILHECSHAILHHEFRALPIWLLEGTAVYFEFPRYMRDQNDERRLRYKWVQIKKYLDEGTLPDLHDFLNISIRDFQSRPPGPVYTVSWSLVQLLMSTPENRRAMNDMLRRYQAGREPDCAALMNSAYPGGLAKMSRDWKEWITRGAANVLGDQKK